MQEPQEAQFRSLGLKDPLETDMATPSCVLVWRIPRTEEPVRLQSTDLQRVWHDRSDLECTHAPSLNYWVRSDLCCCCSAAKSCLTVCNPMDYSTPESSVLHYLLEFAQTYVHWAGDAISPFHPLPLPFTFAFNLSQRQGLCQGAGSSQQVANVLKLQLQYHSFQWIFRVDFL